MLLSLAALTLQINFRIAYVRIADERVELVIREISGRSKVINSRKLDFVGGDISGNWRWSHNTKLLRSFAFSTDHKCHKLFLLNIQRSWQTKEDGDWNFHSAAKLLTLDYSGKELASNDVVLESDKQYFLGDLGNGEAGLIRSDDFQHLVHRKGVPTSWSVIDKKFLPKSFRAVTDSHKIPAMLEKALEPYRFHNEISQNREWVNIDLPSPSSNFFNYLSDSVGANGHQLFYDGSSIWRIENDKAVGCSNNHTKTLYYFQSGSISQCLATRSVPNEFEKFDGSPKPSPEYRQYFVWPQPPFVPSRLMVIDFKSGEVAEIGSGLYGFPIP